MALSIILDEFFQQQEGLGQLKPDFCEDFAKWYRARGAGQGQLYQDCLSTDDAIRICSQVTTKWFRHEKALWPTVLGNLLCVINDPLRLDMICVGRFRDGVGSYLRGNDIIPWWENFAVWGILVSPRRNVVLSISASVAEGQQGGLDAIALAGNFRKDDLMAGQLTLAKDLCERLLGKPDTLRDAALGFLGSDPNERRHPDEEYRLQSIQVPFLAHGAPRISFKLSFYIALIGLLVVLTLFRAPLPRLYDVAAFWLSVISLLGLILSIPWSQAPKWRSMIPGRRTSNNLANRLDRTYFQTFIHDGETESFQGASAGLAFFWIFAAEVLHKRGLLLPWQRKLRDEMKYCAVSAKLDQPGNLLTVGHMREKLRAIRNHNGHCQNNERIKTIVFAVEQWGEAVQAWQDLTQEQGIAETLAEGKIDRASDCIWVRSREGLTLVACPSVDAFLSFFRPAWNWRWFCSRVFVVVLALLFFLSLIRLMPPSPTIDIQIGGKEVIRCPKMPSALCVRMPPGEGVVVTMRVLSPRLLWPSRLLLDWPLDLSVMSSDAVCSDKLSSISSTQAGSSYPLSKEIHKRIQAEEEVTVYCVMPLEGDTVQVETHVIDKLSRDDSQTILFLRKETSSQ